MSSPDLLTQRLTELQDQVGRAVHLTPAAHVRARGDRRTARVATTAIVVVVVVLTGGAGVAVMLGRGIGTAPVGEPNPPVVTSIPERMRLPHDGVPRWASRTDPREASVFQPCSPSNGAPLVGSLAMTGRLDARTADGPGIAPDDPQRMKEQVLLFGTRDWALGAVRELAQAADTCGWRTGLIATGDGEYLALNSVYVRVVPPADAQSPPTLRYLSGMVEVRGNAVIIVYGWNDAKPDRMMDGLARIRQDLINTVCGAMSQCDDRSESVLGVEWPTPVPDSTSPGGASPR